MVQLDRDVEGDWLLVDGKSATVKGPMNNLEFTGDNTQVESQGMAYLDETEDFRGYSEKSSMEKKNDPDTVAQIGQFFRRSSTRVKQKFEETDFKGGAQNLGKSIADASKRTGAKISKGVKEINVKEKSVKVKTGFLRFATKVKGLFSKSDSGGPNNGEEESKEVKS